MAYNKDLDVALKSWEHECSDGTKLFVSVQKYGEGEPKLQIGPRSYQNKNGETKFRKVGRLMADEAMWVSEVVKESLEFFE